MRRNSHGAAVGLHLYEVQTLHKITENAQLFAQGATVEAPVGLLHLAATGGIIGGETRVKVVVDRAPAEQEGPGFPSPFEDLLATARFVKANGFVERPIERHDGGWIRVVE